MGAVRTFVEVIPVRKDVAYVSFLATGHLLLNAGPRKCVSNTIAGAALDFIQGCCGSSILGCDKCTAGFKALAQVGAAARLGADHWQQPVGEVNIQDCHISNAVKLANKVASSLADQPAWVDALRQQHEAKLQTDVALAKEEEAKQQAAAQKAAAVTAQAADAGSASAGPALAEHCQQQAGGAAVVSAQVAEAGPASAGTVVAGLRQWQAGDIVKVTVGGKSKLKI